MYRRSSRSVRAVVSVCALILVLGSAGLDAFAQNPNRRGRKYKPPPPTAKIEVSVLRDTDGKPVENAAVIFHTLKEKGNMELKSNEDGKAMIDVLEIGETIRLQIIAKGFQTYGADYPIENGEMAIEVRMKRPGEQYSIYKARLGDKSSQEKPSDEKPKDEAKPQP